MARSIEAFKNSTALCGILIPDGCKQASGIFAIWDDFLYDSVEPTASAAADLPMFSVISRGKHVAVGSAEINGAIASRRKRDDITALRSQPVPGLCSTGSRQ